MEESELRSSRLILMFLSALFMLAGVKVSLFTCPPVLGSIGALLSECWETTVGQELFKLSVIDLVALVFSVLAGDLIVALTIRFLNCCPGRALDLEKVVSFSHSTELHGFNIILN